MFEHWDAGEDRHILKNADYPIYRVTYDGLIARLNPGYECAAILDVTVDPPKQLAGLNARLNGWSDGVPDKFYQEALAALRELQGAGEA